MTYPTATIETNKGSITIELWDDVAPKHAENFQKLAKSEFYDGLIFHRVIKGFMIQGGCPLGTGTGGPGYRFEDEFSDDLKHDRAGILSMANAGPGTNGSQIFITHGPTPHLNGGHTVFGAVKSDSDQAVVNDIRMGDTMIKVHIEGDTETLLTGQQANLDQWNAALSDAFPDL